MKPFIAFLSLVFCITCSSQGEDAKSATSGTLAAGVTAGSTGAVSTTPPVLKFPNSGTAHVHHGKFWPTGTDLGRFWWEAWIKVAATSHYWVSEGYGGGHALLLGWGSTRVPTGNMFDGTVTAISFGGDYLAADGEWLNDCCSWDGTTIRRYVNGIIVYSGSYSGVRRAQQGTLYIGGSHHQCFHNGSIGQIRGFEGTDFATDTDPLPQNSNTLGSNFAPQSPMPAVEYIIHPERVRRAAFYASYHGPGGLVPDYGAGYGSPTIPHPGNVRSTAESVQTDNSVTTPDSLSFQPMPEFVVDEGSPFVAGSRPLPTEIPQAPASVPPGAVVFDSFGRRNQTFAFQKLPTLGSTEGGSAGALAWTQGAQVFAANQPSSSWGILAGRARCLRGNAPGMAFVETGIADQDVSVNRSTTDTPGMHHTGLCFRVVDFSNFWGIYTTGSSLAATSITVRTYSGGVGTTATTWVCPATSWTTLRLVATGANITGYVDNGSGGWTQIGTLTSSTHQTATKAGLYAGNSDGAADIGAKTFKNFTVLAGTTSAVHSKK